MSCKGEASPNYPYSQGVNNAEGRPCLEGNLVMLPCEDTVCIKCLDHQNRKELGSKRKSRMGLVDTGSALTLKCPVCFADNRVPSSLRSNFFDIKEQVKSQAVMVFCDNHPDIEASCYCESHQSLICEYCSNDDKHERHKSYI
jgi:hypothetical protein